LGALFKFSFITFEGIIVANRAVSKVTEITRDYVPASNRRVIHRHESAEERTQILSLWMDRNPQKKSKCPLLRGSNKMDLII
jgi:hypothetical protein